MEFEQEYTPTEPVKDKIFIADGHGKLIEMEVADDVSDN